MATEPSKLATVSRNASTRSLPSASRRDTSVGMTLASVVISAARRRPSAVREVGEVVDVAVEHGGDVGPVGALELGAVERVGVGLGDDPDARPAGVAEHHGRCGVAGQRQPQQVVADDRRAQARGVVAELADLGRRLVDEAEVALGGADGAATGTAGRPPGPSTSRAMAGSARSRPWSRTRTVSPAESRPRTSRRSRAESACWIDVPTSMADHDAPAPTRSRTASAVGQPVAVDGPHARPSARAGRRWPPRGRRAPPPRVRRGGPRP